MALFVLLATATPARLVAARFRLLLYDRRGIVIIFFIRGKAGLLAADLVDAELVWRRVLRLKRCGLLVELAQVRMRILRERAGVLRSEERRVGKESRSRWSPYH